MKSPRLSSNLVQEFWEEKHFGKYLVHEYFSLDQGLRLHIKAAVMLQQSCTIMHNKTYFTYRVTVYPGDLLPSAIKIQ